VLARAAIKKTPEFQRATRAQVETSGIRAISVDGAEVFHPWATIDQVWETTRAFHLLDLDGRVLAILPKRALDSPDLLPALRSFLKQAVAQRPPAAAASTTADESQPSTRCSECVARARPLQARQHRHWRSVTVTLGSTDSVVDLCSRGPCGYGHLCGQGIRGSSPPSPPGMMTQARSSHRPRTDGFITEE
jgi:hypothetical protein